MFFAIFGEVWWFFNFFIPFWSFSHFHFYFDNFSTGSVRKMPKNKWWNYNLKLSPRFQLSCEERREFIFYCDMDFKDLVLLRKTLWRLSARFLSLDENIPNLKTDLEWRQKFWKSCKEHKTKIQTFLKLYKSILHERYWMDDTPN